MTDDKEAGELIYWLSTIGPDNALIKWKYGSYGPFQNDMAQHIQGILNDGWAVAYSIGRKAERERCAKIAESEPVNQYEWGNIVFGLGEKIAEKIRGGQDGK